MSLRQPLARAVLPALAVLLASSLWACDWLQGAAEAVDEATRPEPVAEEKAPLPAPRVARVVDNQGAEFMLGSPPTTHYRTAEPLPQTERKRAERITSTSPQLSYAPCLARAAAAYASFHPFEPEIAPPRAFVEFALHWAGCPDSAAAVRLYYTTEDGTAGLHEWLARVLAEKSEFSHAGLARAPGGGDPYRWTWALLLTERNYGLTPFPRSMQVGQVAELQFTLEDRLRDPEVLVMPADGEILHADLFEEAAGWKATVTAETEGELWVEVLASGPLGPEVVALFPVYVGEDPPHAWLGTLPPDESWIASGADAEALMLELLNNDRATHGLPPLEADGDLAAVARAHSGEMRDRNYFAHVSPFRGTLGDRLNSAAYEARFSAENIARNPSVYDAEAGLMESLGHRANILSPRPTKVGIGIVAGKGANGDRTFFITQNFAKPVVRPSPDELRKHMAVEIDGKRLDGGKNLLDRVNALDTIANDAAKLAATAGFDADRINTLISRKLERNKVRYRRFRVQYQQVLEPDDFDPPDGIAASDITGAGLGVATIEATATEIEMLATLVLMIER